MGIGSISTVKSGNWSDPTVWSEGRQPLPGELTQVMENHEVLFDVDQGALENGIALTIDGILNFAPDINTLLKVSQIQGLGCLRVGTATNPIQRPAAGDLFRTHIEFGQYAYIHLYAGSGSNNSLLEMHAWHHPLEYTELAANATAGQNQIQLEQDLDLQTGDIIGIGRGEYGSVEEMDRVYDVAGYDKENRIVTLNIPLVSSRFSGDLVNVLSSPILIHSADPLRALMLTPNPEDELFPMDNVILDGCTINARIPPTPAEDVDISLYPSGWTISHCKAFDMFMLIESIKNSQIRHCNSAGNVYMLAERVYNVTIDDCCALYGSIGETGGCSVISNCKEQNSPMVPIAGLVTNHVSKKGYVPMVEWEGATYKNSYLEMFAGGFTNFPGNRIKYVGCTIIAPTPIYTPGFTAYNTIIQGNFLPNPLTDERPSESFNHNNLPGNYKAWTKGGTIETEQYMGSPQEGHLIFNCQFPDYPVFRDYPVILSANRWSWWVVKAMKSFTGGTVKMELIDPAADPINDPTAAPLTSNILPNEINKTLKLKISYKSNRNMPAILRISAKNDSGTVEMDTRLIERRIKYGR